MYRGQNNSGNNENCYVIQFFKKGNRNQPENYRPISLLTEQNVRKIVSEKNANVCDGTQNTEP